MPSMMNILPKKQVKAPPPPPRSAPPEGTELAPGMVWNSILGKSMLDPARTDFVQAFRDTFHPDHSAVSSNSGVYAHSTRHVPPNAPREPSPEPIFGPKAETRRERAQVEQDMRKGTQGGGGKAPKALSGEVIYNGDAAKEKSKVPPSSGSAVDTFYDALTRQ